MPAGQLQKRVTKVPEIRKGDKVVVLTGKDAGKRGTVERVITQPAGPQEAASRSTAPAWTVDVAPGDDRGRRRGPQHRQAPHEAAPEPEHDRPHAEDDQQGGILDLAQPLPLSKVMLVCTHCDKPTRIAHRTLDNGRRVRVCRHCGEQLEVRQ